MSRDEVVRKIVAIKVGKALKWSDVAAKLSLSKEWATAACLGQMTRRLIRGIVNLRM